MPILSTLEPTVRRFGRDDQSGSTPNSPAANTDPPQATSKAKPRRPVGPSSDRSRLKIQQQTQPTEPPMTGSAERIWAKIVQAPGSSLGGGSSKRTAETKTATGVRRSGSPGSNAEVREVWMWGNVALHQDPAAGKTKGQEASGEAVYLDNRGKGKAASPRLSTRPERKDATAWPHPARPGRERRQQDHSRGIPQMNQETDQAWATGPGTMTQLAARGFLTDKSPDAAADAAAQTPGDVRSSKSKPKPKNRAGIPVSEKAPMTITFTERMEFNGRTTDPDGQPVGQGRLLRHRQREDGRRLLHCEEQMITFTDKEVPLAQLGAMSKGRSKPKAGDDALEPADEDAGDDGEAEPPSQAELTRIYCYKNAVGINRKVDPDTPTCSSSRRSRRMITWSTTTAPATSKSPARELSGSLTGTTNRPRPGGP